MTTDRLRLADPDRSRVVLVGTATYQDEELPDIPPVARNVQGLAEVFRDPELSGLGVDNCRVLIDTTRDDAIRQTARWCREAEDVLVVYFSGHGLVDDSGSLLLAFTDTETEMSEYTGLAIDLLRRAVQASPARTRVLILDCCYSGRAIPSLSNSETALLGQVEISGTYTLTSAPRDLHALYRDGDRYTVFSGELIAILRDGIATAPALLSVDAVYRHLRRVMRGRNLPEPKQAHSDTASDLALVRNAAFVGADSAPSRWDPAGDPFKRVDLLVGRANGDAESRLLLINAARDPRWPMLARLRMACELAELTEISVAVESLDKLGVPGDARQALTEMREFISLLTDDKLWESELLDDWDVSEAEDDPALLWGLMMAMWLFLSGLPTGEQIAAAVELVEHGHREQAESILKGMLRRRDLQKPDRREIEGRMRKL